MSAIDDLRKAREAVYGGVWTWERHGDGWALYVDRGLPIGDGPGGPFVPVQHGLNILTVGADGFDSRGEPLRAFIVAAAEKGSMLKAERDAERKAWARFVKAAAADMGALGAVAMHPTVENIEDHSQKTAEYWAAKRALEDVGVDVDSLSGAT